MTEPEKFLARWLRRKRGAADETRDQPKDAAVQAPAVQPVAVVEHGLPEPVEPPFDLASLPSIESITAETDIRAFFTPGVPRDLLQAALRRAWSADPAIRDFVGLADYAWDYHTPGSMQGFGPLEMTDELRRVVAQIVGGTTPEDDQTPEGDLDCDRGAAPQLATAKSPTAPLLPDRMFGPATAPPMEMPADESSRNGGLSPDCDSSSQVPEGLGASQHGIQECQDIQPIVRRAHGRALPK